MDSPFASRPAPVHPLSMSQVFRSSISSMPKPFMDIEFDLSEISDIEDIIAGNEKEKSNKMEDDNESMSSHLSMNSQVYSDSSDDKHSTNTNTNSNDKNDTKNNNKNKNKNNNDSGEWMTTIEDRDSIFMNNNNNNNDGCIRDKMQERRKPINLNIMSVSNKSVNSIFEARYQSNVDSYMNETIFENMQLQDEFELESNKSDNSDESNNSYNSYDNNELENNDLLLSKTNTNNTNSTTNEELIEALPFIIIKFDVLFPFYRLSDKDCKQLSLFVLNEINSIDKIFCNAKGRSLEAIIYYNDSLMPKKISFYNDIDSESEISQWKDIEMTDEYCRKCIQS